MNKLITLTIILSLQIFVNCQNNRPIIGILTQPDQGICTVDNFTIGTQYIAASYVKYMESAGARVIPIQYDLDQSTIQYIFNSINGLLLPGGGVDFGSETVYTQNLQYLWNLAIDANNNGDVFPIWGTCMGFQELNLLAANNFTGILTAFNSENYTVPLNFTAAAQSSTLFKNAPQGIFENLSTLPITMNNHAWGVSPQMFKETPELFNFYEVLSTNADRDGNVFISTIEALNYPIYGTQWHPEKPLFEWWDQEVMNHSYESILANQYTANFFVNQCRSSNHAFSSSEDETAMLIYNYNPIPTYDTTPDFEQCYCF